MAGGLKLPTVRPVERNAVSTIHTLEKTENHPGRWKALGVLAAGFAQSAAWSIGFSALFLILGLLGSVMVMRQSKR